MIVKEKLFTLSNKDSYEEQLTSEAMAKADEDIKEYFMSIFSKARQITVEKEPNVHVQIKESYWTEAKWRIILKWGSKRRKREYIPDIVLSIFPGLIGYSLNNMQDRYPICIIGIVGIASAYVLRFYFEANR